MDSKEKCPDGRPIERQTLFQLSSFGRVFDLGEQHCSMKGSAWSSLTKEII